MIRHAFVLVGVFASLGRADQPIGREALQAALAAKLEEVKAPGGLVGIYRDGKPPVEFGVGLADVRTHRPITPDCHFRIASISKVFVAQTLLTLVDEGKISADDPIARYVPGVPQGDRVTIRHLATHRSGVFNPIESREVKKAFGADPSKTWTAGEILGFSIREAPYAPPRREAPLFEREHGPARDGDRQGHRQPLAR